MNILPRTAKATLLAVVFALLAACGGQQAVNNTADEATVRPAPITTASGELCTPWVNQPGEADGSGYRACDMPIPQDRPVRSQGMSDADWFLMGALWGTAMGHSDFYYGPGYYGRYIGPAWNRHPGYSGYGWGRRPITRITNYNVVINHEKTTYAADAKKYAADPKYSTYKSASGKTYNSKTVPKQAFRSSNVGVSGPAGDAPPAKKTTTPSKQTGSTVSRPSNPGSYSKPSYSRSTSGSSSRGGGHK